MTEGVFLLTALFVAYVIYVIVNEKKEGAAGKSPAAASPPIKQAAKVDSPKPAAKPKAPAAKAPAAKVPAVKAPAKPKAPAAKKPAAKAEAAPKPIVQKAIAVAPAPVKKSAAPAKKPVVAAAPAPAKKPVVAAVPAPAAASNDFKGTGLKDPKSGEVATAYSNYRFTKRWIKEALVAEKLVDKVYKNDELNANIEAKIKAGLIKLEDMGKYKP